MGPDLTKYFTIGFEFERAFIQHEDLSITHLNFSREAAGKEENMGSSTCGSVVFRNYPTMCNAARIPQLDEETGRIVQDLRHGFRVIGQPLCTWTAMSLQTINR